MRQKFHFQKLKAFKNNFYILLKSFFYLKKIIGKQILKLGLFTFLAFKYTVLKLFIPPVAK